MSSANKHRRLVTILFGVVLLMFGFGFALVPIYNVMCKAFSINGKVSGQSALSTEPVDTSRTIAVQFLTTNNANIPWKFIPLQRSITLHPGENKRIAFMATNNSPAMMTIQAIPSITPSIAAKYLKKTECFCFTKQTLKGNASMEMPVLFHIERDLPKNIRTVTLSYTLFDVTQKQDA